MSAFIEWMNSLPTGVGGMIGIAVGVVLVVIVMEGASAFSDWCERRRMAKWAAEWCPCGNPKAHEPWCSHRVRFPK